MTKRYDASAPREYTDRDGNKKTAWNRVGTAFEKDGKISVLLDCYPLPGPDGVAKIVLMEPRERDGGQRQQTQQRAPADLDDECPF